MFKTPNCTIIFVLMLFVAKKSVKIDTISLHIARTNSYLFFLDFEVIKAILEIFKSNTSLLNKFLFRLSFKGSWLILFICSLISCGLSFNTCISTCICHRQIEFLERIGVQFKEHSSSSNAVFSTEEGISLKKNFDLFCLADFYFLLNAWSIPIQRLSNFRYNRTFHSVDLLALACRIGYAHPTSRGIRSKILVFMSTTGFFSKQSYVY